ncbi:MAG: hypothetical protein M1817_000713 [Caeruleum heppii]|nr:MAG: hypothetical protein M1817_000713 [Caeruleum heppii]
MASVTLVMVFPREDAVQIRSTKLVPFAYVQESKDDDARVANGAAAGDSAEMDTAFDVAPGSGIIRSGILMVGVLGAGIKLDFDEGDWNEGYWTGVKAGVGDDKPEGFHGWH